MATPHGDDPRSKVLEAAVLPIGTTPDLEVREGFEPST